MSSVTTSTDLVISTTTIPTTTGDAVSTSATTSAIVETTTIASTTTTLPPSTSIVTAEPSTSYAPAPTTANPVATTIVTQVTSIVTESPTNNAQTQGPIITTITRTQPVVTYTPPVTTSSISSSTSSAAASQSALNPSGHSSSSSSGGLTDGATIAIAVIIPILAVVGFVLFGLWFWRRRKAKKNAEEERKNDMAEYGFNPNNDPTLPVGAGAYTEAGSEANDDSGYRGWGTTSSANRKPSTTLGSNSRAAAGQGLSDAGSQPGGYNPQPSPSAGAASDDPIVHGYEGAAAVGVIGGAAAAGTMAVGSRNRHSGVSSGIHRGISNASSAYSAGAPGSEVSYEANDMPRPYYQEEVPYNVYNENQTGHGPYTDGAYGGPGDDPVIRDVQARRNTRIERAPTFPQQGGIAQNF